MSISRNGTEGRVYGGDCSLIHCEDGKRVLDGARMAGALDLHMRHNAAIRGEGIVAAATFPLCPGCYMVVGVNMLAMLAEDNGQPITELAASMVAAWQRILESSGHPFDYAAARTEEIQIILDPEVCR